MFWHQNQGSSIWGSRDINRFVRDQRVIKRRQMRKKKFRFLDRLPYFPFYRTIVLNEKYTSRKDKKIC